MPLTKCIKHPNEKLIETGHHRCRKCRSENVSKRRKKVKLILVKEAGGACRLCGYNKYVGALHFHHLDPKTKSFSLSNNGLTKSITKLREEASKCILLCANCHAETHIEY
jgi:5-methylcytosine-specific restriction endonuclease McrA